ncbi:MAG: radical SAM protein [Spirochaetia bacterium]|nr:radical SAM protein [Spirochaetia bacterium]
MTKKIKEKTKKFSVILIKPSAYDEDGYVVRFKKGVLPSNTLACLYGLTQEVIENDSLGEDIEIIAKIYDEVVDLIDIDILSNEVNAVSKDSVFCMVGVQTHQFPRASEIARLLRKKGHQVMMGGFHISGVLSVQGKPSTELQKMLDIGVSLTAGEVEEKWVSLLKDAYNKKLKPVYNFLKDKPELETPHLPQVNREYLDKFSVDSFSTLDCGRGCPFKCSFCTVINVHGNLMRHRPIYNLKKHVMHNFEDNGVTFYFFTDDNFSRNKRWSEIFDALIDLRQNGYNFTFMMQVDMMSYKIPNFMEKAVKAGCTQVFMGMESINPENLIEIGKKQNKIETYREMINAWRSRGVMTHVGYIIGFTNDTYKSIKKDIKTLAYDIHVDMASFFILTPLPGSKDHTQMLDDAVVMRSDLNWFDTFHPVVKHPKMSEKEWLKAYNYAWEKFYSLRRMQWILKSLKGEPLRNMYWTFLWYKYSIVVCKNHPMVSGFHRLKDRKNRRPEYKIENVFRFFLRRTKDWIIEIALFIRIFFEFLYLYIRNMFRFHLQTESHINRLSKKAKKTIQSLKETAGSMADKAGEISKAAESLTSEERRKFKHKA